MSPLNETLHETFDSYRSPSHIPAANVLIEMTSIRSPFQVPMIFFRKFLIRFFFCSHKKLILFKKESQLIVESTQLETLPAPADSCPPKTVLLWMKSSKRDEKDMTRSRRTAGWIAAGRRQTHSEVCEKYELRHRAQPHSILPTI
jgi:hypothetical protein